MENKNTEKLLRDNPNRFVMFPIKYNDIWEKFNIHRRVIWQEAEVDLSKDLYDWNYKLNDNERFFVKNVLAFFAASDGIVMENLSANFCNEIQIPEVRAFYTFQSYMELVHSIMYSQLIETYITDLTEKDRLFRAIEEIPAVKKKANWALKWISSNKNFATRMVAFACVEGIFFSGSFCCIYWLKEKKVLQGLCLSNDFIARDEGLHTDFAVLLYNNYIENKIDSDEIYTIFREAVEIEEEFITESIPCDLLGMNASLMKIYIQYVADRLLKQLNYEPLFNVKNPFPFMDNIGIEQNVNFFDARVSDYQKNVDIREENNPSNIDLNNLDMDF